MADRRTHILVLNYNGRRLLAECLPSVVAAARAAAVPCAVSVVDNASTDDSRAYLRSAWPEIGIFRAANHGLASFNAAAARLSDPILFLLNNDVKLETGFVEPLLAAFEQHPDCFMAGPQCWTFDGRQYEGMRSGARLRFGLVQALARTPKHRELAGQAGYTACIGPVLAVDRRRFLALGGYDSLYWPGRIEDLDLCFRGWCAGWKAYYVPEARAYHKGFGTFHDALGEEASLQLALRNTLLFTWKNFRTPRAWIEHLAFLPLRLAQSLLSGRPVFARALAEALRLLGPALRSRPKARGAWTEREFFRQFEW